MKITLENIEKKFNEETLFRQINYTFEAPCKAALLGINGSGKSTLLQIISGYLSPGKGKVKYSLNEIDIAEEDIYTHVALCAPYLELIEELTLHELLQYHFAFKKPLLPIPEMIAFIGLDRAKDRMIDKYSSGMKQRVKLAQAFFSDTAVLLLDEPCMNLDEDGIQLYTRLMDQFTENRIVIVASNDKQETAACTQQFYIRQNP